jgi:hypothetical protein
VGQQSPRLALHHHASPECGPRPTQRSRRHRAAEIDDTVVALPDTRPFGTAATDPAWRLSLRDLDRALARIREEQRQVILLIALESTYEEAATILDVADRHDPIAPVTRPHGAPHADGPERRKKRSDERRGYHERRVRAPMLRRRSR